MQQNFKAVYLDVQINLKIKSLELVLHLDNYMNGLGYMYTEQSYDYM